MNTPFPFDGMLTFAFLSVLLLTGVGLRAKVGFIQRFLVPSCLIGGVLGLVLMHTGVLGIQTATIGLTFAAVGYFFAFFVGVPLVNRGIRNGRATFGPRQLPRDFLTGILNRQGTAEPAGRLTIHSGNAETLAFQSALVGGVYCITFMIILFLGGFLPGEVAGMLWGFFFFFGLGVALAVKWAMQRLNIQGLVNGPLWWGWPLWAAVLVFTGIMAVALTLMKLMGLLNGAPTDGLPESSHQ